MPIATYKDLCIDATDALRLGRFWASALGLELHEHEDGDAHLTGPTPQHTVWINRVPEPRTVKQRWHLDLNVGSVAELERLGATVVDGEPFRWTLMADPEGGELCAFVREGEIESRLYEIVVDTADSPQASHAIAAWWARVLGAEVVDDERGYSWVQGIPGAPFGSIDFAPVPEPKTVKNRIHLDLTGRVEDLVTAGATVLRAQDDSIGWTVLADPEGNEFCVFAP